MNWLYIYLMVFSLITTKTLANDVLGCGGFLKSHVQIDFSKVEIKLLTKQGMLKDKTYGAPNNGYYFVPLYDKGEYVLELIPPPGWSFTPTKVELKVDGLSDLCSQGKDINFIFKGFGITGKVESYGSENGPENVEVVLISGEEKRTALTGKDGVFFFTPVYPGEYTVTIADLKWKLIKNHINIKVTEGNTNLPPKSLIIQGYDITGIIKNNESLIKDIVIALFAINDINRIQIDGCLNQTIKNNSICEVVANEKGLFKFKTVPFGKYYIVPHNIVNNVYFNPKSIEFDVNHNDLQLTEYFEIIGFNVFGKVLKYQNGEPIENTKIYLNGKEIAKTGSNGEYKLEKINVGVYKIKVEADGFEFDEKTVKINSNIKNLDNIIPSAYYVSGTIIGIKSQEVVFTSVDTLDIKKISTDLNTGKFFTFLRPGIYQVQVVVKDADIVKGLQYFPRVHTIEVINHEIKDIVFSQLKATITGKIYCLKNEDCSNLKIILTPVNGELNGNKIIVDNTENKYLVKDVYPGIYNISLSDNKFCWKSNSELLNVNNTNIEGPTFTQNGYIINFISSHNTLVNQQFIGSSVKSTFNVPKGKSTFCLDKPGLYNLTFDGCHTYDTNSLLYNTQTELNQVHLEARKHIVTLHISSDKNYGDIYCTINIDGIKKQIGPLKYHTNNYIIELLLDPSETAIIIPHSDILYFKPPILQISGSSDCEDLGVKFIAESGHIFKGKIIPPLAGVQITIECQDSEALMMETSDNGEYKFSPVEKSKKYKIKAEKLSYVFIGPNNDGDFFAQKLAEITVQVLDNNLKTPLEGVLISLSGDESYRSNLQTDETGKLRFSSLNPSSYFLRAMKKEYNFEPQSHIINVEEGQVINITLFGSRVAFSAYGNVVSLNGEPEIDIGIVAQGLGNCSHFSEESVSDLLGLFRVRGLQPYCDYELKAKYENSQIERSIPDIISIKSVKEDIINLKFIVIKPILKTDILVKVFAINTEYYKNLRLKISSESPTNLLHTIKIDTTMTGISKDSNSGILVHVPQIQRDNKIYSVQLESNLKNYNKKLNTKFFTANSTFIFIELNFTINNNLIERDIKHTSTWTIIFVMTLIFLSYIIDKKFELFQKRFHTIYNNLLTYFNKKYVTQDYTVDTDDIDQIVQNINATKRKNKNKKA